MAETVAERHRGDPDGQTRERPAVDVITRRLYQQGCYNSKEGIYGMSPDTGDGQGDRPEPREDAVDQETRHQISSGLQILSSRERAERRTERRTAAISRGVPGTPRTPEMLATPAP